MTGITDEVWEEFTTAVARAAMNAGLDGAFVHGFVGEDNEDGTTEVDDRAALVNSPVLTVEGKRAVQKLAIEGIAELDFSDAGEDDNPTEHRHIDLDENLCDECGGEKKAIPPPEGAAELRDGISRLIIDSGLVRVANFNLVFKNGCEDVNVTPACDCGDTTGECFVRALHSFSAIIGDVAEQVESGKGFSQYDGEGSEEVVGPLKH